MNLNPSEENEATNDARKFGFRTTTKSAWEALRAEYLVYRQQLVEEINAYQDSSTSAPPGSSSSRVDASVAPAAPSDTQPVQEAESQAQAPLKRPTDESTPAITLSAPYPYGCLLFIKNIHSETNKTTLKSLFGKVLTKTTTSGIDYVDFSKGMDTCYLRLSTPASASLLSTYFASNPTVQANGLDDTGSPLSSVSSSSGDLKPITAEVVLGTREQVYWQKVPEKIRRGAVEKAVQLQAAGAGGGTEHGDGEAGVETREGGDDKRSRKRRKR